MKTGTCSTGFALAVALVLTATVASAAEHRENRWGYGMNMGGASAGLHAGSVSPDREIGAALGFRAAYGFKPDFTIGLELMSSFVNTENLDQDYFVFGPSLTWYPGDRDFFLRGTFGIGDITFTLPGGEEKDDFGVGAQATAGYEIQIVRTVTFTAQADYGFVHTGNDTWGDVINFSLGFAWYPGGER